MPDVRSSIAAVLSERQPVPLVSNQPADLVEPAELPAERTPTAKVFDLGNGQRRAKVYTCPVHYHDGSCLRAIDCTVKRKPLDDPLPQFPFEARSGLWHAHFDSVRPWNYRFAMGDSWVEHEALFDESDSLSIRVDTHNAGVKETITLLDEKAPTRFDWRTQWSKSRGGIIVPNPTAVDAGGRRVPVHIQESNGILTCELDVATAKFPIQLDPTSVIATSDGFFYSYDGSPATYASVRNVTSASASYTNQLVVGQDASGGFEVYRSPARFAIPNMTSISAASMFLEGSNDTSTVDFDIYIHTAGPWYAGVDIRDFTHFTGWKSSGAYDGTVLNNSWNSSSWSATWNEITFAAAGLSAILAAKNTTLCLVLISKEDYDSSEPTDWELVSFEPHTVSGKEPYLSLTYTLQLPAPVFMNNYRRRRAS